MKKVLAIGGAALDTIITYEDMETLIHEKADSTQSYLLLEEGAKIEVTGQKYYSGGGATNAAVSLSMMGHDVTLFCKLGKDPIGQQVLEEVHSFGIDTSLIRYSSERGTASSFVIPSLKGDRVLFAYRGANTTLLKEDLPLKEIADADFIYVTSLSQESAARLPEIAAHAQNNGTLVAVNPGISQLKLGTGFLRDSLPHISVLILNLEEAQQLMTSLHGLNKAGQKEDQHKQLLESHVDIEAFNLRDYFAEVLGVGVQIAVVTNGSQGVYVAQGDQVLFHHAQHVDVINTLGAGDAFGSSFVGALQMGKPLEEAIRCGILNSASVVTFPDAKSGLLNFDTLQERVSKLSTDLLETL